VGGGVSGSGELGGETARGMEDEGSDWGSTFNEGLSLSEQPCCIRVEADVGPINLVHTATG
jgi:hypothetical protein